MGGLREDTIEAPAKTKKGGSTSPSATQPSGTTSLRFHEDPDTGQVHFHDDANGLKVGMPVATWYSLWQRMRHSHNFEDCYVDPDHNTALMIKSGLNMFVHPHAMDCTLSIVPIQPIQQGSTFQKLNDFMPNKKKGN